MIVGIEKTNKKRLPKRRRYRESGGERKREKSPRCCCYVAEAQDLPKPRCGKDAGVMFLRCHGGVQTPEVQSATNEEAENRQPASFSISD
jgi:hypothetical protein